MVQALKTKTSWYIQRRNELIQFCQNQDSQKNNDMSQIQESQLLMNSLKNYIPTKDILYQNSLPKKRGSIINNHHMSIISNSNQTLTHISNQVTSNSTKRQSFVNFGFEQNRLKSNHQLFQDKLFTQDIIATDSKSNQKEEIPKKSSSTFNFLDGLFNSPEKIQLSKSLKPLISPTIKSKNQGSFMFSQRSLTKIEFKNENNKNNQSVGLKKEQNSPDVSQKTQNTQIVSLANIGKYEDNQAKQDEETTHYPFISQPKTKSLKLNLKIQNSMNVSINNNSNFMGFLKDESASKQSHRSILSYFPSPLKNNSPNIKESPKLEVTDNTSPIPSASFNQTAFFQTNINRRKSSFNINSMFPLKSSRNVTINDNNKIFQTNDNNQNKMSLQNDNNKTSIQNDNNKLSEINDKKNNNNNINKISQLNSSLNTNDSNNLQMTRQQISTLQQIEIPQLIKNKSRAQSLNPPLKEIFTNTKSIQAQTDFGQMDQYSPDYLNQKYFLKNKKYMNKKLGQSMHQMYSTNIQKPQMYVIDSSSNLDTNKQTNLSQMLKSGQQNLFSSISKANGYLNQEEDLSNIQEFPPLFAKFTEVQHIQSKNTLIIQQFNEEKFGKRLTNVLKLNKRINNSNKEKILNFLIQKNSTQQN